MLDIVSGLWNFNEWSPINTPLAEDWVSLYNSEFWVGTVGLLLWFGETLLYGFVPFTNLTI